MKDPLSARLNSAILRIAFLLANQGPAKAEIDAFWAPLGRLYRLIEEVQKLEDALDAATPRPAAPKPPRRGLFARLFGA